MTSFFMNEAVVQEWIDVFMYILLIINSQILYVHFVQQRDLAATPYHVLIPMFVYYVYSSLCFCDLRMAHSSRNMSST